MSKIRLLHGDVERRLQEFPENTFHSVVSDPPYGLHFLGRSWDKTLPSRKAFAEIFRTLRPGALGLLFSGTRTFHRLAVLLEDCGFQVIDCLSWIYGNGLPKGQDLGKCIDRKKGNQRTKIVGQYRKPDGRLPNYDRHEAKPGYEGGYTITDRLVYAPVAPEAEVWEGYKTLLRPAWEPIVLVRKPGGTLADNCLLYGTSGLNIPETRIAAEGTVFPRYPANAIAANLPEGISRYFYAPKVMKGREKKGNPHPTVKPVSLCSYLALLLRPPRVERSTLLVPFAGSGSEIIGAHFAGWLDIVAIERKREYVALARERVGFARRFATEDEWRAAL